MTFSLLRVTRPAGLAGFALLAQIGGAHAEINDGLLGALSRIFAPPPPHYMQPLYSVPEVRIARPRRAAKARGPRAVHASLPGQASRSGQEGKTQKVTVREPNQNAVAAVMNDSTLRRGDIVVLANGPKVFKGGASAPFRPSDFEDPRQSKMLGDKTRRDLMALRTQPTVAQPIAGEPAVDRAEADPKASGTDAPPAQAWNDVPPLTITVSLPRKVSP